MKDKFNAFKAAKEEAESKTGEIDNSIPAIGIPKKEKRENFTLSILPSKREKLRKMAKSVNMGMSELVEYWIDNQK